MDEPLGSSLASGSGYRPCADYMDTFESLRTCVRRNADQIHDNFCALNRSTHGVGITYIGLHRMDLADIAHRLQMPR
jgi:hypothetical protein